MLALASVAGSEFEPAVVAVGGRLRRGHLLGALEEATAARLVVDVPGPGPRTASPTPWSGTRSMPN